MNHRIIVASTLLCIAAAWSTQAQGTLVTYEIRMTEEVGPGVSGTFTGDGSISFDLNSDPNTLAIADFSFNAFTLGSVFDGVATNDVIHQFSYTLPDIVSTMDVLPIDSVLSGLLTLADKSSVVPAVIMQALTLNFSTGMASGFCFDAVGGAQCIRGGGSSTALEAHLSSTAAVSEPPTLPIFAAAGLISLSFFRLRRLRTNKARGEPDQPSSSPVAPANTLRLPTAWLMIAPSRDGVR